MATARGRRVGQRTSSRTPFVEEIVPNFVWSEDSIAYYLRIDLPGFKKEEVKLQVDSSDNIIARGEKQVNKEKNVRFLLTFPAPINSYMDKMEGEFDGEILHVTIPKQNGAEKANGHFEENEEEQNAGSDGRDYGQHESCTEQEETSNENADSEGSRDHTEHGYHREKEETRNGNFAYMNMGGFSQELVRKWVQEHSILRSAVQVLRKNKGIVITAVLAFSLGLLVSCK